MHRPALVMWLLLEPASTVQPAYHKAVKAQQSNYPSCWLLSLTNRVQCATTLSHALAPVGHASYLLQLTSQTALLHQLLHSVPQFMFADVCVAHSCCHFLQMLLAGGWTSLLWIVSSTMMCLQTPKTTSTELAEQLGLAGGFACYCGPYLQFMPCWKNSTKDSTAKNCNAYGSCMLWSWLHLLLAE